MLKVLILLMTLILSQEIRSQNFFEGDISYQFDLYKKDSSFDETSIITYPAKTSTNIFKNGDWIESPNDGIIEFLYFNHTDNKIYWKIKGIDTVLYELGNESRESEIDSTLKSSIEYNTDTVLGYNCNRLVIQTRNLKLTFIYTPLFALNPLWYQNTIMGYYNLIYGLTKAIYLKSIVETKDYISTTTAQNIILRKVSDTEFPDVGKMLTQKL